MVIIVVFRHKILVELCEKEDEGMTDGNIYKSIAERTGGEIYAGVVGPVRTGKSTFIKRFMELFVVPGIENTYVRTRVVDQLPQSGDGEPLLLPSLSLCRKKRSR